MKREEAKKCWACYGTGDHAYSWYDPSAKCPKCDGRGWIIVVVDDGKALLGEGEK